MAGIWDILGAGLNLGAGIYGAVASSSAAKKQTKAQKEAAKGFAPYTALGTQAAGQLQAGLAPGGQFQRPFNFQTEPGYQFRLSEGEKGIDRAAGARGMRYSGATLKGLQRFAQDYASNEYGNAYARDLATKGQNYNFLAGGVNAGQGAQGQVGGYLSNAGDARAAGQIGAANALAGGINNAVSGYNFGQYLNQPVVRQQPYGYPPYQQPYSPQWW